MKPFGRAYLAPLDADGNLIGSIKIPIAVGTVGGATKTSKKAMLAMKIMGIQNSNEFSNILACVGLTQNFAALRREET